MEKLAQLPKGFLKNRRIFKDPPKELLLRLVSLCLGAILWYFIVGEDQVDINVVIPIEVLNLPSDLVISNPFKKDIEVSVRGPRSMIQDLRNRNITRPVNLSDAKHGRVVIKNDGDSIPFPKGITVLRLQPTNTTIVLDRLIKKDFSINPVTEGKVTAGYMLKKITLEPNHLTVSGPETVLNTVLALKTYVINLDGLNQSTSLQLHLALNPEFLNLIGETVVSANIEVEEAVQTKTVHGIPVNVREAGISVKTDPEAVTVEASIPENLIRDTPELAMLFRASASAKDVSLPRKIPVNVTGINVPGHTPIKILAIRPTHVRITPLSGSPTPSNPSN